MRSLSRLLVLVTATTSVACTDALPTGGMPSAPDASVRLDRNSVGLAVGDTTRLVAQVRTRAGAATAPTELRWRTSDPTIAIVEDGLIVPLRTGTVRISASTDLAAATATVNVWTGAATQTLAIEPDSVVLTAGRTMLAAAALRYSTGTVVRLRSSVTWKSGNTAVATIARGRIAGRVVGETHVVATIGQLVDTARVVVAAPARPTAPPPQNVELPRVILDVAMPAVTGRSIRVNEGDDLQAAINGAQPGDEIVVQAGATFVGAFTLPKKAGDAWIVIRSSASDQLPPAGTRVTPAHAPLMPKLVGPRGVYTVLSTNAGAHHYRLIGLEITAKDGETSGYTLLALGDAGSKQSTLESQPHHLVLDRMYVHGTRTLNFQRCIALNSASTAIVDSWISECHGKGFDSQAIGGWNGTGPYKIVNNHLAGAGENVMFGGADPKIPGALPRDIEFRRNHVYKPAAWKGIWSVKNSFELKLGQRILVEANVFENNWPDAQDGFAILMKSVNQGGGAPWSETSDVTFRYNVVRNSAHGVSLAGAPGSKTAVPAHDLYFAHNVFEQIGDGSYRGGRMWQVSEIHGLTLDRNTSIGASHGLIFAGRPVTRLVMTDNILGRGTYTINSNAGRGTKALDRGARGWTVTGNVFVGASARDGYPPGNRIVAGVDDVPFRDLRSGDLRLRQGARIDAGADADSVYRSIDGVVIGVP